MLEASATGGEGCGLGLSTSERVESQPAIYF